MYTQDHVFRTSIQASMFIHNFNVTKLHCSRKRMSTAMNWNFGSWQQWNGWLAHVFFCEHIFQIMCCRNCWCMGACFLTVVKRRDCILMLTANVEENALTHRVEHSASVCSCTFHATYAMSKQPIWCFCYHHVSSDKHGIASEAAVLNTMRYRLFCNQLWSFRKQNVVDNTGLAGNLYHWRKKGAATCLGISQGLVSVNQNSKEVIPKNRINSQLKQSESAGALTINESFSVGPPDNKF